MVSLKNVTFSYDQNPYINDLNLDLETGKITTLIGLNGSGKSTLLRLSSGLLKGYSGQILINEKDIKLYRPKERARLISVLPQGRNVPMMTVYEFVSHGRYPHLSYRQILSDRDKEIIDYSLKITETDAIKHKCLAELSGGQRQKAYLAMVIAQDSKIVFLDEPATYLDVSFQYEIMDIIRELCQNGRTIVMVMHDIALALKYSHSIVLMDNGKILIKGTPQEIHESGELETIFHIKVLKVNSDYLITKKGSST